MALADLPKSYEPRDVEARWEKRWEEERTFTPDPQAPCEPYSIVIPPPNVTGQLHIGHALNMTIQDILCRHARQLGKNVLWVPGMDHAGIATQNVVERALHAEGKTREDLGRAAFTLRVWEWKEEYGGRILRQIRRLGASVDWTRERFTMDEGLSRAVRAVFVRLHQEGLIYQGDYIVNWCTRCRTALADDEVEYAARPGSLWRIRYPVKGGGELVVATTRPETMLGDTAVAVNPEDERYRDLIGRTAVLPLVGRAIPVIGDAYVDREFGTGALKVTPSHDPNDWELGQKHGLEFVQVIDGSGRMKNVPEKYAGLTISECRAAVVEDLRAEGLLVGVDEHEHSVGACYRCKTTIEPHVSRQWFVAVKPLAAKAKAAVDSGETTIFPEQWKKTYDHWLENIRDWCISRQIWWGHRIPAWTCRDCREVVVAEEDPTSCPRCKGANLVQEEDVLDTWFSSALWPFSTLGWPDGTRELKTWYPTAVLVTAFDILFFWVARMMMMGTHFMGRVPFKDVYIHALVRDAEGKKMSKSTGNVIDPIEMIDRYGCDALRFTLAASAAMGRDVKLSEERIEGYRHFVNKLWNASRFALMNLPEEVPAVDLSECRGLAHEWILARLEEVKAEVRAAIAGYRFNDAASALYQFTWRELCDWYLEMAKADLSGEDATAKARAQKVLSAALSELLVLLHPFMPFVTREIWSHLPGIPADMAELALAPYPPERPGCLNESALRQMKLLQEVVTAVRNVRAEMNIQPSVRLSVLVRSADAEALNLVLSQAQVIRDLARVGDVAAGTDVTAPKASASAVIGGCEVFVPLAGAIDFAAELARLDKDLAKVEKELGFAAKKLSNPGFTDKAPAEVVQKERDKQAAYLEQKEKLLRLQERLRSAMS
jgi:valyl-tRNA synthetase